jgi:Family of unknown function (DUF6152)
MEAARTVCRAIVRRGRRPYCITDRSEEDFMTRFLVLAAGAVLVAGGALAHHGWGSYDAAKPFTIRGQVETLRWQNPHVHVDVKHQGATWEAVLAPPFRMEARGLKPDMIKAGTMVALEGYALTRIEREMRAERITVNGKAVELR